MKREGRNPRFNKGGDAAWGMNKSMLMSGVILMGRKLYFKSGGITMTFKGRLIVFLGIFCIATLIASSQVAQGKPDKPGKSHTEWIQFIGDLEGGQPVDGCCPNAGPNPEYRMYLSFQVGEYPAGWYDGYLFINHYGAGRDSKYIVQFWKEGCDAAIEIIGGVIDYDKRTKILTVTFTDEVCWDLCTGSPITEVTFTLIRQPNPF
jgi:hypothetical protein